MSSTQHTLTWTGCWMVALAALFYLFEFFLRVSPSAMPQELMAFFHTHASGLGLLASAFFWGYAPMQIPAGILGDRFGPKPVLVGAVTLCALATGWFAYSPTLQQAATARFLMGMAASFAYLGPLMLAEQWLPRQYFPLVTGLIQVMGCLGAMVGGRPIAQLMQHMPWQQGMLMACGAAMLLALAFFMGLKQPHHQPKHHHNTWLHLKTVVNIPQIRWTACAGFACWAPMAAFAELWAVPYLMQLKQLDAVAATTLTQAIWWGAIAGGPFFGWLTQFLNKRLQPLLLAFSMAGISELLIFWGPTSTTLLTIALFLFGAAASAQCITFGLISDWASSTHMGTAMGFNNMAVILGGIIVTPLIGLILQHAGPSVIIHDAPVYALSHYRIAFTFIPACTLLGLWVTWTLLHETHGEPQ